ncbi:MAG TPA: flagellar motor stator protein MotA [Gemmatimonadaceae bacterium]|nr:flagellar motor stator protein MotA [Gemmatimonadaceae bacterium]
MLLIIGLVIVIGSILLGYVAHHGQIMVLWQWTEFVIIGGAGLGAMLIGNPPSVIKGTATATLGLLKRNPYDSKAYGELLQVLYAIFQKARKEGLVGIESHIEEPEKSAVFAQFPDFMRKHHAVAFLTDTLKVLLTGAVEDHHLAEILDVDLEQQHEEAMLVPHALARVGDAMPGFGIVAAVLGVIITMGKINGSATEVGMSVAAALVGTFLGILLAYGIIGPIATSVESRIRSEHAYMQVIRTALLSFARGDSPMTAVEFARRNIEPSDRPSFSALEQMTRRKAA